MRKYLLFLLLPLASLLTGCPMATDEPEPEPAPAPAPGPGGPTGRTVLVYMAARNSLGSSHFDEADLDEMTRAAAAGALGANRLLVFHALYGSDPMLLEITNEGRKVLKTYEATPSSVRSERMLQVIADMREQAPADNYGLILWSHGTGWIENGVADEPAAAAAVRPKSFGQDGAERMNITTLARTLEGQGFDYVYFDCCFMMGVEVVYQMRDVAPVIVGSVSELPANGMPYDLTLPYLMATEADLEGAAAQTFSHYDAMSGAERTCTMSVIHTEGLARLAQATAALYRHRPTLPADYRPQQFVASMCRYFDFLDYVEALAGSRYAREAAEVRSALSEVVTYSAATPYLWEKQYDEVEIHTHCGLSTQILRSDAEAHQSLTNYDRLDWYADVASHLFE